MKNTLPLPPPPVGEIGLHQLEEKYEKGEEKKGRNCKSKGKKRIDKENIEFQRVKYNCKKGERIKKGCGRSTY